MDNFTEYFTEANDLEAKALAFAINKHSGQTRKFSGKAYVSHPINVAKRLKKFTSDSNLIAAAYLHDTVEDTDATLDEIKTEFNDRVASLVKELTSSGDGIKELGKQEYLVRKMNAMSTDALTLKLTDRLDNISDAGSAKFKSKYNKETRYILDRLQSGKLSGTHNKIIKEIRAVVGE